MDEIDALIDNLHEQFGAFAMHLIDFASQQDALAFAGFLSFTSGAGLDVSFPENVSIGLVRGEKGVVLVLAGCLTVDQNYEVMCEADRRQLGRTSQGRIRPGLPDKGAIQAFTSAQRKLAADHPELRKPGESEPAAAPPPAEALSPPPVDSPLWEVEPLKPDPEARKRKFRPRFTFREQGINSVVTFEKHALGVTATIEVPGKSGHRTVEFPYASFNIGCLRAFLLGLGGKPPLPDTKALRDTTGRKWSFLLPASDHDRYQKWLETPVFPALEELMDHFCPALDELEVGGVPLEEAYAGIEFDAPDDQALVLLVLNRSELIVFRKCQKPHSLFQREFARFPFGPFQILAGLGEAGANLGFALGSGAAALCGRGTASPCRILDTSGNRYIFSAGKDIVKTIVNRAR